MLFVHSSKRLAIKRRLLNDLLAMLERLDVIVQAQLRFSKVVIDNRVFFILMIDFF